MSAAFDDSPFDDSPFDDSAFSSSYLLLPAAKITALLATGYAVHRSLSPPNPPPSPKTCIDNRTLFERAIRHVTFCSKMMTWTSVLADSLVTFHLLFPSPITRPLASTLLPSSLPPPTSHPLLAHAPSQLLTTPSLLLLLGATLAICGSALRLACFRALGTLFTFELTISPSHHLVRDGPYAFVRHPSYTGVYATLLGASLVMLSPSAWLHEAWLAPSLCALSLCAPSLCAPSLCAPSLCALFHPALSRFSAIPDFASASAAGAARPGRWCPPSVTAPGSLLAWLFVAFWLTKVAYALRSTNKRVLTEDHELHRVFGDEWETWAARVRWRLLPGIF